MKIKTSMVLYPQESMSEAGEQHPYGTPVQAKMNKPRYVFQRGRHKGG